ncbi:AlpA family transcriptional regulator [Burkholderia gladioli]|uniref:AlpA family transcriptional regulator n=1 Tax=Burkholderia gladioli TaxID=28095 RepID=UPI00163FC0EB|nr:AlpA family transcriptional regulator [Burkholderia gladioli]
MKALNIKQVMEKVGLGKSTIYRMIAAGDFPKSFVLAGTRTAWLDSDVDEWLAQRAGRTTSEANGVSNSARLSQPTSSVAV